MQVDGVMRSILNQLLDYIPHARLSLDGLGNDQVNECSNENRSSTLQLTT